MKNIKNKINMAYIPLIIFEVYLFLTIFLYYFGPLKYDYVNQDKSLVFLLTYQLVFFLGYRNHIKKISKTTEKETDKGLLKRLIYFSLFVAIGISYISLASFSFTFNPIVILKDILQGVSDPASAYAINLELVKNPFISSSVINIGMMLLCFFSYLGYSLGTYYFKEFSLVGKSLVFLSLALEISTGLIRGTNIGVFRIVVIVLSILVLKMSNVEFIKRHWRKLLVLFSGLILIFVLYFTFTTSSRMNLYTIPDVIFGLEVDKDDFLFKILPKNLRMGYIMISFYLSQGYQAFSRIFDYNFHSTFGFGNGWFIMNNFSEFSGLTIFPRTYVAKMRSLWNPTINWHTAYTWFANDFSVYGTIIIMYWLGKYSGKILTLSKRRDALSIAILPLLVLLLIFIPANNVVLSTPQTAIPFIMFSFIFIVRELFDKTDDAADNYLFLGSVYEPFREIEYLEKSKGNGIQNAINTHQWNLIEGISKYHSLEVISSRYLHTFPKYRDIYVSESVSYINDKLVTNVPFVNLPILKQISKSIGLFRHTFSWAMRTNKNSRVIFCYYPSSILLLQSVLIKTMFKNVTLISILPDLPEHTNLSQEASKKHGFNQKISNLLLKNVEGFILLTEQMAQFYGLPKSKYFVMEGMVNKGDFNDVSATKYGNFTVLYTGSLNIKYGIKDLVDEFLDQSIDAELHIYGKGEYEEELVRISKEFPNIKYFGYVSRENILIAQSQAHILINPRKNIGDFNKYSFPSKNLEYILSGTPFVGYKLDGITDEYFQLYNVIGNDSTLTEIVDKIKNNYDAYNYKAKESREYIVQNKERDVLCKRMLMHFNLVD